MPEHKKMGPHSDPDHWAKLNEEQVRCLVGLKAYWVRIMDKDEVQAWGLAWEDLKHEFPELAKYPWFQGVHDAKGQEGEEPAGV